MIEFHGGDDSVWDAIAERAGKRTSIAAAIAYVTDVDALPLKAGDVLICNLSKHALATGSSNPMVAHKLAVKGVEIRSHDYLHAKVIIAGETLFVGSMNASDNSVNQLDEAAIETTDRTAHSTAFSWIQGLRADLKPLSPADIKKLFPFYNKPKGGAGGGKKRKKGHEAGSAKGSKTWYLSTKEDDTEIAKADAILEEGPADDQLAGYELSYVNFSAGFKRKIKRGDYIINRHQEGRNVAVWPAAIVWRVKTIGKRRCIFTAYPASDAKRTMTWKAFTKLAEDSGMKPFTKPDYARTVFPDVATKIADGWPNPKRSWKTR